MWKEGGGEEMGEGIENFNLYKRQSQCQNKIFLSFYKNSKKRAEKDLLPLDRRLKFSNIFK